MDMFDIFSGSEFVSLKLKQNGEWLIYSQPYLDREEESDYNFFTIACLDENENVYKNFSLRILDENDNPPIKIQVICNI